MQGISENLDVPPQTLLADFRKGKIADLHRKDVRRQALLADFREAKIADLHRKDVRRQALLADFRKGKIADLHRKDVRRQALLADFRKAKIADKQKVFCKAMLGNRIFLKYCIYSKYVSLQGVKVLKTMLREDIK